LIFVQAVYIYKYDGFYEKTGVKDRCLKIYSKIDRYGKHKMKLLKNVA